MGLRCQIRSRKPVSILWKQKYWPVLLLPQNTHWFTRSDLATEPHDMSKLIERDLVLYALKTPASADLFHIWVFDKLGLEGAKPIPGLSSSGAPDEDNPGIGFAPSSPSLSKTQM